LFELNDTLYTKAHVESPKEVYLWLGVSELTGRWCGTHTSQANVMLAYPVPEAEELLTTRLSTAQSSLETCEEDLLFLREQVTVSHFIMAKAFANMAKQTMEVATARVYNWDVQQRRKDKTTPEEIKGKASS
jgi:Prefoldin subunit